MEATPLVRISTAPNTKTNSVKFASLSSSSKAMYSSSGTSPNSSSSSSSRIPNGKEVEDEEEEEEEEEAHQDAREEDSMLNEPSLASQRSLFYAAHESAKTTTDLLGNIFHGSSYTSIPSAPDDFNAPPPSSTSFLHSQPGSTTSLWVAGMLVSLSAFALGYNTVVLNNPTNPDSKSPVNFDDNTGNLNSTEVTQATSIAVIGGLIGSLFVSIPNERYGRKVALHLANVFYLAGAILASAAVGFWMLLLGRLLSGVGWGAAAVVVPQLLSEISPPSVRGSLTVLNQGSITLGAFCCVLLYDGLESIGKIAWRISIGLGGVPTILQVALTLFIPESPIWLMRRRRSAQARAVLIRLRPKGWNVARELGEATQNLARTNSRSGSILELLNFKKSLVIGVGLMFFLQFTGINVILYYSTTIFVWAGVRYMNLATSGVMALNCIMTFVSTWLVDRWGRRPLLLTGLALMTPSLAAAGLVMIFVQTTALRGIVALIMVLFNVAGFAIGLGAVVWPLVAEVFPSELRSKGLGLCGVLNGVFNLFLSLQALGAAEWLGQLYKPDDPNNQTIGAGFLFTLFSFFALLGFICTFFFLPETKGKSFQEVEQLLN